MRPSQQNYAFPIRVVMCGMAAMLLIALVSAAGAWAAGAKVKAITQSQVAVLTVTERLRGLTELTEVAANLAVSTGQAEDRDRYFKTHTAFLKTLTELRASVRLPENAETARRLGRIDLLMTEMESRAIALAAVGRLQEAQTLLSTDTYLRHVGALNLDLRRIQDRSKEYVALSEQQLEWLLLLDLASALAAVGIVGVAWFFVLRPARRWGESMLENMQETIFRTDAEGHWEFLNPAWEKLTGHPIDQSLGQHASHLFPPAEVGKFDDSYRTLVDGEVTDIVMIQRFCTAEGELRTGEVSARALHNSRGRFIGTVGNIRDITVQQRAEQALIQSKREFETLAMIAPVGIVRSTSEGAVNYCNPTWLKLAGLTKEEAQGAGWASALHVDDRDRVWNEWSAAVEQSAAYRTEFRFVTDTSETWVDVIAEPELAEDGELLGYVAVLVDITERKALEETLIRARGYAEDAAVAKSAFLANMSHEIRTPMNGVLGFAELLLNSQLDEEPRRFAQMIVDSGREMMRLLNDILDLSKIEARQMTIISEPTDLSHLLGRCIRLMSANAESKGVTLALDLEPGLPAAIMGDGQRIRQVALNLIGNALKFTDRGHVTVRARSVCGANDARYLRIEVEDSGIGISPEQQDLIFEPFAQADGSTARRYGGSGLGLTICRQLVHGMNGTLSLDSEPGRGSIFRFTLPLIEPQSGGEEIRPRGQPPTLPSSGASSRALHILLAEDLDVNQQLVTAILTRAGHRVTLANDGAEAIEKIDEAAAAAWMYDLVLMDIQMPNIDGYAATRAIRSRGHGPDELPIIALTANAFPEEIAACLKAGMQAHLAKPISLAALAAALLQWGKVDASMALTPPIGSTPGVRINPKLRDLYCVRKAEVLAQVERMTGDGRYDDEEANRLAGELHKLAGTAALFGEQDVGMLAAMLERQLLEWNAEERRLHVVGMATRLKQASV